MRAVDATELGSLVTGLAGQDLGAACPYDELPDTGEWEGGVIGDEDAGVSE
jgi:hypothetical protein